MVHFFQINKNNKPKFFNHNKKEIPRPKNVQIIPTGFPIGVLFHPPLHNKIFAYVIDNKGRTQYFYTKEYKEKMENEKYNNFPKLIPKINKLLKHCKNNNNEICKSIVLMQECNFRIGHEKYKKLYDTNGALTINHKHLKKTPNQIDIEFLGKKKEINFCSVPKNSSLFSNLENTIKNKSNLFKDTNYNKVRTFLQDFNLKPKDIRQYSANANFFENLKNNDINQPNKKYLKHMLELTAKKMNHTPSVCKKEYLMPQWFTYDTQKLKEISNKNNFHNTINILHKNSQK